MLRRPSIMIPLTLDYIEHLVFEDDCIGVVIYMPAHAHKSGDELPCSTSLLMIF